MFRQPSMRHQRTKGFKIKHALKVSVLVAICIWLLYQVKHSYDQKIAFEESNAKISSSALEEESKPEMLRFGRKDPPPRIGVARHYDDEGIEEGEESVAEPKLEEKDEDRGTGDDKLDEGATKREEEEFEHGEGAQEEERQVSELASSDNKDPDRIEDKSQEAHERHYKGDDASSAVTHGTQTVEPEIQNVGIGNMEVGQADDAEKKELETDGKSNGTSNTLNLEKSGGLLGEGENHQSNRTLSSDTATTTMRDAENGNMSSLTTEPTDQIRHESNSTSDSLMITPLESHDNSTLLVREESTGMRSQNATAISDRIHYHNSTIQLGITEVDKNPDAGKSTTNMVEQTGRSNATAEGERLQENPMTASSINQTDNTFHGEPSHPADELLLQNASLTMNSTHEQYPTTELVTTGEGNKIEPQQDGNLTGERTNQINHTVLGEPSNSTDELLLQNATLTPISTHEQNSTTELATTGEGNKIEPEEDGNLSSLQNSIVTRDSTREQNSTTELAIIGEGRSIQPEQDGNSSGAINLTEKSNMTTGTVELGKNSAASISMNENDGVHQSNSSSSTNLVTVTGSKGDAGVDLSTMPGTAAV